ncbi:cytokine-induced anti-apoptosis inhibitor 1, Fe-S biogenesis-domain-containing protein [Sphaerosporella brunnea]|uniref:Cytokine-induced anti-apoptosis inhibitor 1, Fe-S biogenesis-domain-containing protein n=1 Tax=Sphaerosporella brunnea TaxID=1250544 RepID=A0A5J5F3M5_9PEZI|nr:cytokine-induced anti-apoptosis inhibitor 1, Fe-S biogenesis-domain-containing protein [Sphaerosporella brunnea]
MASPPYIDTSVSDFNPTPVATAAAPSSKRTLILCPPSVSSHPEALENALSTVDRVSADVQMLDRLTLNLASLPDSIYSTVLLLSDPSSSAPPTLEKPLLVKILAAMAPNGRWRAVGANKKNWAKDRLGFLTAGFLVEDTSEGTVAVKPDFGGQKSVALNLRKRLPAGRVVKPVVAKPAVAVAPVATTNGVGFVYLIDDLDDDELIDEDELMADEDLATPVQIPAECRPKAGKRRRACKDCTCGLKEQLEQEDAEKRSTADKALAAAKAKAAAGVKLNADDLAEIDFTVEGKASSCGNCYLGDAFRCSGCPYIGLPAFKPGEQVQIDMMDDQL